MSRDSYVYDKGKVSEREIRIGAQSYADRTGEVARLHHHSQSETCSPGSRCEEVEPNINSPHRRYEVSCAECGGVLYQQATLINGAADEGLVWTHQQIGGEGFSPHKPKPVKR